MAIQFPERYYCTITKKRYTKLKFMFGNLWEEWGIYLAKKASEQEDKSEDEYVMSCNQFKGKRSSVVINCNE